MTTDSTDEARIAAIAAGLSDLERALFLGQSTGWGSWMFAVGGDLCVKGLGRKHNGSISFDTPDAAAVRSHLEAQHDPE